MDSLQAHRDFYARLVMGHAGSSNPRLLRAFARVERESFLGPGPWQVLAGDGYIPTLSDDPRLLYQDVLIALAPGRGINNGQPSLHARALAACAPQEGELALHIGAGTGYYSAILAEMVGPSGAVLAYEIDPELAERARANLARWKNASLIAGDAMASPLPPCNVLYVSAGASHPLASWLDALEVGGRLVFPMTTEEGSGFMLMVCRWRPDAYTAACLGGVRFIHCVGARDRASSAALATAMAASPPQRLRSLHRGDRPGAGAWCAGDGWWLSTER